MNVLIGKLRDFYSLYGVWSTTHEDIIMCSCQLSVDFCGCNIRLTRSPHPSGYWSVIVILRLSIVSLFKEIKSANYILSNFIYHVLKHAVYTIQNLFVVIIFALQTNSQVAQTRKYYVLIVLNKRICSFFKYKSQLWDLYV